MFLILLTCIFLIRRHSLFMTYNDQPLSVLLLPSEPAPSGRVQETTFARQTPVVERIRQGVPFSEFRNLRALLDIPEEALGKFLGMSTATLHRRKKAGILSSAESERLVRFTRLFGLALGCLGTREAARSWLKAENPGTAGESPLSYADTEFGAREVENLLGRIEHGVF